MQVRYQILKLLLIKLICKARHHVSPAHNCFFHVLVRWGQAAGEVLLFIKMLQSRPFISLGRISRVAVDAVNIKDLASLGLLLVESQFGICHL